jgi:hydrogen peroxide-dependent heme synthase
MHNPFVPETFEGWSLLHLMFRVRWDKVRELSAVDLQQLADEAVTAVGSVPAEGPSPGATAWVQMLGHKADLMVICFRRNFEALGQAQLALSRSKLHDYLEPTTSYVSIVELGQYDMTAKMHKELGEKHAPGSDEFEKAFDAELKVQEQRVMSRLFIELPQWRYVCFYPMNKRRGEAVNWYSEPYEKRLQMMRDHGMIGRTYHGRVQQIISGSIGYDDWEWGVDLFAPEPVVFKKLVYEMRFDEASAKFGEFGPFYTGLQFSPSQLGAYLSGQLPALA